MKANELMIGDIVTFKDCQNDKKPVIIKIWSINQDGESFAFIDNDESVDEIVIDDEIVGFPITPEILEKNGFNHWDEDYNDFIGDYYTFLSNKDGGYNICIDSKMTISGHIDYVHELQHALKLCEIEKNIEL